MPLTEEELVMLFETFESIAQDIVQQHVIIDDGNLCLDNESNTTIRLKQDCINLIVFGEPPEE